MKFSGGAGYWPALMLLLQFFVLPVVTTRSSPVAIDYWQTSVCPQSCSVAGPDPAQWTYYHDATALDRCNETTLFEMTLSNSVADPDTHLLYRSCAATGDLRSSSSTPQRRQHLSYDPNEPREAQATVKLATWGKTTSSSHISSISSAVSQLANYWQQQNPSFTSLFARSGTVVAGLYVGVEIDPSSVAAIAHKFLQHATPSTFEREAAQICDGPNFSTGPRTFGLIYDTTGDLAAVQSALQLWHNASCVTGSHSNTDLGTTTVHLIPGNEITIGPEGLHKPVTARSELVERATCSYTQVQSGDTCSSLSQKCNITLSEFESYNGGSSMCSSLQVGQYVCCSSGSLPGPPPYANGTCYTYTVQSGDTCSALAAANTMNVDVIENNNNNTWGWMGCGDLLIGMNICLSPGNPPYPVNVPNSVCGPQVNNTVFPANYTEWAGLNPCPLNACCDIWGQCGITSEFCTPSVSSTGAPGTAAPGSNGCISNCGTAIVASSPPASFRQMGYFESFNDQRPCLHMTPSDIPSSYTDVLFAFGNITSDYDVSMAGAADVFQEFLTTTGFNKIVSFGGWTFSTDPSTFAIFGQGVAAENRSLFAGNVASFIQSYNLQGVNFDWEYPGPSIIPGIPSGSPEDGTNYLAFLNEVRNLLPSNYSISITAPASYYYLQNFPIYEMSQVVDFIVYMTYDLHGQWDYGNQWTDPGCPAGNCLRSQTNQTETQQAFSMITKAGVPASMIMVGQPLYGRSFQMTTPGCYTEMCTYTGPNSSAFPGPCTGTAGYISNWEINQIISNSQWSGTVEEYYSEDAGDILVYDSTQWVSWMKPSTYDSRSSWAQGLNFGGVCDWAMDLNASYAANGSQIGEGSGVVYIPPDIYSSASPTVTCLPPCTFVLPPWTLTTNTTIVPPATTMTVEDIWPSVSTSTNGITSTYYLSSTTVTTITMPPIITDTISVWNVEWTDTSETIIYLTSSIIPPPFTETEPPNTQSSTTLPGTTYTFAPEVFPPATTSPTGPPPGPPPPGYTISAITVTSGPPGPQCTDSQTGCGGLCQDGCEINPPCIGICGCIGGGCSGGGGCIGPRCNAIQNAGGGPDGGGEQPSPTTCATSTTITDCSVACSVTDYGDSSFVSNCYTTACSTVMACQSVGSTTTTETTTAICPLTPASYPTWTPVSGSPLPYLGTDNSWTTPGPSTSGSDGSGSGNSTTAGGGGGSSTTGGGGGTSTTGSPPPPNPTRKALIMLSELVNYLDPVNPYTWDWVVIEGVTTSTTDVCTAKQDISVPADTVAGSNMGYPDRNIGPFTCHGISGCTYYGTTNGETVGTMTCPGVGNIKCEKDPQFATMWTCGPGEGSYVTADVKCIF